MMLWKKSTQPSTGFPQVAPDLEDRLRALEKASLEQTTALKLIRNEWEDTYEKMWKLTERMRKRAIPTAEDALQGAKVEGGNGQVSPPEPLNRHELLAKWKRGF